MLGGLPSTLQRALWKAFGHNAFTIAKSAAYSELLSLFPALLVVATLLSLTPATENIRGDVRNLVFDLLPTDTMYLVQGYFNSPHKQSLRLVFTAGIVAIFAAMGVMLSFMEGFRRAYRLPRGLFGFWKERLVAFLLIPSALIPMLFATAFVVFGHQIEQWMILNTDHVLRTWVVLGWRGVRWLVATVASVAVLQVIYHFSVAVRPPWQRTLPGAILSTLTWFASTLAYGWYVTRFADYSRVYGSLGAGIATMVWLYFVSIAVLVGCEFNAQMFPLWKNQPATTFPQDDRLEYPDCIPVAPVSSSGAAGLAQR